MSLTFLAAKRGNLLSTMGQTVGNSPKRLPRFAAKKVGGVALSGLHYYYRARAPGLTARVAEHPKTV